jgi:hypothetical protein
MPYVKAAEYRRLQEAEEACFGILLGIELGQLEMPLEQRQWIASQGLERWSNLAAEQGLLRTEEE